ncbi:hypothetical protein M3Y99_02003300 [Aphelenchoides fujianensis]|nr:hypothetical protein M3Y99_02003300 [Aphelenchoides fujianensis]
MTHDLPNYRPWKCGGENCNEDFQSQGRRTRHEKNVHKGRRADADLNREGRARLLPIDQEDAAHPTPAHPAQHANSLSGLQHANSAVGLPHANPGIERQNRGIKRRRPHGGQ